MDQTPAAGLDEPAPRLAPLWDLRRNPPAHLRGLLLQVTGDVVDVTFGRPLIGAIEEREAHYSTAFCQVAVFQGVAALFGLRVEAGETIVNPAVSRWLVGQTEFNRARNQRIHRTLVEILAQLSARGIEAIPLKGAAMLLGHEESLAWRTLGDIDLQASFLDSRELDLAVAYAGYCLSGASWKHRVYAPCTPAPWSLDTIGGEGAYPIRLEVHPAVEERFRGSRLDLTPTIKGDLTAVDGSHIPGPISMALHLAAHASIATLEGFSRAIQIVDLERALSAVNARHLIQVLDDAGIARYARFVYPAMALVARETSNSVSVEIEAALRRHVSPGMRRWAAEAAFYDMSYPGRIERRALDRMSIWSVTHTDRLRMLSSTAFPGPATLASESYEGDGALALLRWYPRYYRGLAHRLLFNWRRQGS